MTGVDAPRVTTEGVCAMRFPYGWSWQSLHEEGCTQSERGPLHRSAHSIEHETAQPAAQARGVQLAQLLGFDLPDALALSALCPVLTRQGKVDEGIRLGEEGLAFARNADDPGVIARAGAAGLCDVQPRRLHNGGALSHRSRCHRARDW